MENGLIRILFMTNDNLELSIKEFIAKNILFNDKGFPYSDEASFLSEGVIDSIGVMELVSFVSDRFKMEVDPQDITPANFDSVRRLADYIRKHQKEHVEMKSSVSAS